MTDITGKEEKYNENWTYLGNKNQMTGELKDFLLTWKNWKKL